MKMKILAFTLFALFLLAVPALGDLTKYYTATVTVRENNVNEDALTADSVKFLYASSGAQALDAKGKDAACANCHEKVFNLTSGDYIIEVTKAYYVPKNVSRTLAADTHYIVKLTSDKTAPVTSISIDPAANENGWRNVDSTVTLTASDDGAGVKSTKYCTDMLNLCIPNTLYSAPFTITLGGTTYVRYFSDDKATNVEATKSTAVLIDKTAPAINTVTADTEKGGTAINEKSWQNDNDVYFSWTYTDVTSKLWGFSYAIDANADDTVESNNSYYQSGTLSDGKHVFHVKMLDKAGNWGAEMTFELYVDTSTPKLAGITAFTDSAMAKEIKDSVWQNDGTPYFVWDDPASVSGDTFYYTVDGSEPSANSASLATNHYDRAGNQFAEGTVTLKVRPQNGAGTWGTTVSFVLKYDGTAPSTTISAVPANPDGQNGWYVTDLTVTLSCTDALSGCEKTYYSVNDGTYSQYSAPFKITTEADDNHVDAYSTDKAGNSESAVASSDWKLDKTGPVWSAEKHPVDGSYSPDANYDFKMNWTDAVSGVMDVVFTFAGTDYDPTASGSTYSYTLSGLAEGVYKYGWTGTDTAGNIVESDGFTFDLGKGTPELGLAITPSANETYGTMTTASCTMTKGDAGATLKLFRNGASVSNPDAATLDAGTYDYYCEYSASGNYTDATSDTVTLTVNKATPTLSLYLDGSEADKTAERGDKVNMTAVSVGTVGIFIDDIFAANGYYNYDTASVALTKHTVTAKYAGSKNYESAEKTFYLTVRDTTAPVITVSNPVNGTTVNINEFTVLMASNEDLSAATISLDGGADIAMTGSGTDWTYKLSDLSQDTLHYIVVTGTDKASLSTSTDRIYFSLPVLGRLLRTTVDGTYYADVFANIRNGVSTIVTSNITDSTVTNSTVLDSVVSGKTVKKMVIKNSNVDPADFEGSTFENAVIMENDNNYIRYSTVTDSTVEYTDMNECEVASSTTVKFSNMENCYVASSLIEFSSLRNVKVWNANISRDYMFTGILEYNGVNYTSPTNIFNLLAGADTEHPLIDPLTVSNSTPNPGDTVTFTAIAKDNVAVRDAKFNGTAMAFAGGYSFTWTYDFAIPSENGTYVVDVTAIDYAGNFGRRGINVRVNTSETPSVVITIEPLPIVTGGGQGSGTGDSGNGGTIITPEKKGFEIVSAPSSIDVEPGKSVSFEVMITNTGESMLTNLVFSISGIPESWVTVNPIDALEPGETVTRVMMITVPATQAAGFMNIIISGVSSEAMSDSWTSTLNFVAPKPVETETNETTEGNQTAPSGLTGAFVALAGNPVALGFIVALILVGGAMVWQRRGAKPARKTETKAPEEKAKPAEPAPERKYI